MKDAVVPRWHQDICNHHANFRPRPYQSIHNETFRQTWGSFHKYFCHLDSNLVEISFWSHPNSDESITTKFCTCHGSPAAMACAKYCDHIIARNKNYFERNIPPNLAKASVTWAPGLQILVKPFTYLTRGIQLTAWPNYPHQTYVILW